jgi:predicted MPP superfamily phosphohydrolase
MFVFILLTIPLLSLLWLFWALRTETLRQASRAVRGTFLVATMVLLIGYLWIVFNRLDTMNSEPPAVIQAAVLLWGLVVLPFLALPVMFGGAILQVLARFRRRRAQDEAPACPDRRRFLATTAIALPVIATYGTTAISVPQTRRFRIRRLTIPLPDLPRDLDGLTLAHLSDIHVGKFTHGEILHELADATNALKADLVAFTGDLIDHALADLPEAIAMLHRIDPGQGLFLVEGNHDLFEGVLPFRDGITSAGLPLLNNARVPLEIRGHPVDLLGIRWARSEKRMNADIATAAAQCRPDAMPILLAHHPHAFDAAARAGIPLTLSGHTHGGQLMVTPELGPGPMMYRYWSGLYRKPSGHAAVISNGAGNWFPLRTAAPAEILHLTLRRV